MGHHLGLRPGRKLWGPQRREPCRRPLTQRCALRQLAGRWGASVRSAPAPRPLPSPVGSSVLLTTPGESSGGSARPRGGAPSLPSAPCLGAPSPSHTPRTNAPWSPETRPCFAAKACGWSGPAGSSGRRAAHQGRSAGRGGGEGAFTRTTGGTQAGAGPSHPPALGTPGGPNAFPLGRSHHGDKGTEGPCGPCSGSPATHRSRLPFSSENTLFITKSSPLSLANSAGLWDAQRRGKPWGQGHEHRASPAGRAGAPRASRAGRGTRNPWGAGDPGLGRGPGLAVTRRTPVRVSSRCARGLTGVPGQRPRTPQRARGAL